MKRTSLLLLLISCLLVGVVQALAQEEQKSEREKPAKLREEFRRPASSPERLERSMRVLERSMEAMEHFEMPPLPEIPVLAELPAFPEFPEMAVLAEIPPIHIEIPEIHIPEIVIPEIAPIPPIEIPEIDFAIPAIAMPDLDFELNFSGGEYSTSREFRQLSEAEELRIKALQAIARQSDKDALDMIEKVLRQDESAAVRYHAVRMLRSRLDDEKAIDLLADRAQNDAHATVKKTAIRLLGKSGSPRAVDILQKIIQAK